MNLHLDFKFFRIIRPTRYTSHFLASCLNRDLFIERAVSLNHHDNRVKLLQDYGADLRSDGEMKELP